MKIQVSTFHEGKSIVVEYEHNSSVAVDNAEVTSRAMRVLDMAVQKYNDHRALQKEAAEKGTDK